VEGARWDVREADEGKVCFGYSSGDLVQSTAADRLAGMAEMGPRSAADGWWQRQSRDGRRRRRMGGDGGRA
jgi:hypothetical protein